MSMIQEEFHLSRGKGQGFEQILNNAGLDLRA